MEFEQSDFLSEKYADIESEEESGLGASAHQAAGEGALEALTHAIREDPAVLELQDSQGLTPLGHAVRSEKLDSVKLLVKMGANINAQDTNERTCLSMAAYQGWNLGMVFLLRNGAKFALADKSGRTALHSATYSTDVNTLNLLLQSITEEDLHCQDNEGMTALHWACFHDRPSHAKSLLAKGLDPTYQDIDGRTALHWAAQNGSAACCAVLNEVTSDLLNEQDFSGKRAIHFAAAAGHDDVLRGMAFVHHADCQALDNDDRTPLHWAAATGQIQTVRTLLDLNVDPAPEDIDGCTPLHYARQSGHTECVQILENRLGIHDRDNNLQHIKNKHHSNDTTSKSKRNPFSFLADLFRSRKTDEGPSHSTMKDQQAPNHSHKSAPLDHSDPSSLNQDTQLSTPIKQQHESDMLRSIEMIHLSREDNPVLTQLRHSEQALNCNHSNHAAEVSSTLLQWDTGKRVLPPTTSRSDVPLSGSPLPYDALVRSPPPVLRTSLSNSSRESVNSSTNAASTRDIFSSRQEYTREKIEHDAAEILAISKSRELNINHQDSSSHSCGEDSAHDSPRMRAGKIKLAPLKGPVPPKSYTGHGSAPHSPSQPARHRGVAAIQREARDSSTQRPPTPPSWTCDNPTQSSQRGTLSPKSQGKRSKGKHKINSKLESKRDSPLLITHSTPSIDGPVK